MLLLSPLSIIILMNKLNQPEKNAYEDIQNLKQLKLLNLSKIFFIIDNLFHSLVFTDKLNQLENNAFQNAENLIN
jgi:hypothetical protein